MRLKTTITAALALGLSAAGAAYAHTTSLGFVPGTNPGEVTFWTGSYSHGGTPVNEGIGTLTGVSVPYGPVSNPFNLGPVNVKPAGLVDGTNNFFWGPSPFPFPLSTDPNLFGGVVWWQGVTFASLVPGTYSFTCGTQCGVTAQWASLTQAGGQAGAVQVTLQAGDIGGGQVPEPAGLAVLGLALAGLAAVRAHKSRSKKS